MIIYAKLIIIIIITHIIYNPTYIQAMNLTFVISSSYCYITIVTIVIYIQDSSIPSIHRQYK